MNRWLVCNGSLYILLFHPFFLHSIVLGGAFDTCSDNRVQKQNTPFSNSPGVPGVVVQECVRLATAA